MPCGKPVLAVLGAAVLGLVAAGPALSAGPVPASGAGIASERTLQPVGNGAGTDWGSVYRGKRFPYYNGQRGYRSYRRGYRQYRGWWFPPAAFSFRNRYVPPRRHIAPPPLVLAPPALGPGPFYQAPLPGPAHYQWCEHRYRSYRAADNSFQPYHGPRRACLSPYGP